MQRHEPYPTLERQRETDQLGMMLFLGSEIMLFGALFAAAFGLFLRHTPDVEAASGRLNLWLGGANTIILLTSSLFVALGAEARGRRPRRLVACFVAAALLGILFLAVKALEYAREYDEGLMPGTAHAHFASGPQQLFMNLYFAATGLHAVHLTLGVVLLLVLALRERWRPATAAAIENAALYWHLVDVIWIFLYPVLYLTRG